jgi:hypothetical protein
MQVMFNGVTMPAVISPVLLAVITLTFSFDAVSNGSYNKSVCANHFTGNQQRCLIYSLERPVLEGVYDMGIFDVFHANKVNPKRCPQCSGVGIITILESPETTPGKIAVGPDKVREKVCPQCKGIGVVNVPGFEELSMKQIESLVKDRSVDDIIWMFKGMTPAGALSILKKL